MRCRKVTNAGAFTVSTVRLPDAYGDDLWETLVFPTGTYRDVDGVTRCTKAEALAAHDRFVQEYTGTTAD